MKERKGISKEEEMKRKKEWKQEMWRYEANERIKKKEKNNQERRRKRKKGKGMGKKNERFSKEEKMKRKEEWKQETWTYEATERIKKKEK